MSAIINPREVEIVRWDSIDPALVRDYCYGEADWMERAKTFANALAAQGIEFYQAPRESFSRLAAVEMAAENGFLKVLCEDLS